MSIEEGTDKLIKILKSEYGLTKLDAIRAIQKHPNVLTRALDSGEASFYAAAMLLNWQNDNEKGTTQNT